MSCSDSKQLVSGLQMRDSLIAKIIFHTIQWEEVTSNLEDTEKDVKY